MTDHKDYESLKARFADIQQLHNARAILNRDMITVMAPGSAADRTEQLVALTRLAHEKLTDQCVGDWLESASESIDEMPEDDRANLIEMQRRFKHAIAVPAALMAEKARLASIGQQNHTRWKKDGDWNAARPHLEAVFALAREAARARQQVLGTETAYDALIDQFDPYSSAAQIETWFAPVEDFLKETIPVLANSGPDASSAPAVPMAAQEKIFRCVASDMGFDFNRGLMFMVQAHPSCYGTPDDQRFTTRASEHEFAEGLRAVIHETGHGLYEQNLPRGWRYQPAGSSAGMSVHESQSLFWEMQVSHHPAFESYINAMLPDGVTMPPRRVTPSLIRVEADEVTYPMHVFLRFDLEKKLIGGTLEIADLPDAWNEGIKERLGVVPPDHGKGCLQDIHWIEGFVGYFPSYTLGAMMAAQLMAAMRRDLDVDRQIAGGDFKPMLAWLADRIHRHGSLLPPQDLVAQATGEAFNPVFFIDHLKTRFLSQ